MDEPCLEFTMIQNRLDKIDKFPGMGIKPVVSGAWEVEYGES